MKGSDRDGRSIDRSLPAPSFNIDFVHNIAQIYPFISLFIIEEQNLKKNHEIVHTNQNECLHDLSLFSSKMKTQGCHNYTMCA